MIGVVVPVHNEERYLEACLQSLQLAACHPKLCGEDVRIVVVLDSCTDASAAIADRMGVVCTSVAVRNVGAARALGASMLLESGARWLAFTDADTTVCPAWLVTQLELAADAVCGTVGVKDWCHHPDEIRTRYEAGYNDRDGHRHVHGANIGVSAEAYRRAGGFSSLSLSEDVALVQALERVGVNIAWSAAPRVTTSARRECKVSGGFGSFLMNLAVE